MRGRGQTGGEEQVWEDRGRGEEGRSGAGGPGGGEWWSVGQQFKTNSMKA